MSELTSSKQSDISDAAPLIAPFATDEPTRVMLHAPVDVRSISLAVLAALASIFTLRWASAVFIPVMVGLLFSYALSPVVAWLHLHRIPRALSATFLILGLLGGTGATVYALASDASALVELLPLAAQKLGDTVNSSKGKPENTLAIVQKAASQLEKAAEQATAPVPGSKNVQRVVVEKPKFNVRDHLWTGTIGLLSMLGQIGVVALITFFLLASGDTFRRKVVKLAGPTLSKKRITLEAINEIHDQIQRYMLVNLFTSALVGVVTWLCLLAVGLEHAAVWGIAAGVLNLIPYLGGVIIMGGSALVGFMQFGTLEMALLVAAISAVIHTVAGMLLTPWLTSRANSMNPVAIFVGVLAWGWLWGAWGLLLGVPVLVIVKAICDRVDDLKGVGEILGD